MLSPALATLASGLLLWPVPTMGRRLSAVLGGPAATQRSFVVPWRHDRMALGGIVLAVLVLAGAAGIAVAAGLGLLVTAVLLHRRARMRTRAMVAATDDLAGALGGLVTELRAGAHPVNAVETTARDSPRELADRLNTLAAAVRFNGTPAVATFSGAGDIVGAERYVERTLSRVATVWALSARHGIPLTGVLDAVHREVESTARSARQLDARLAGPRAGAAVLACLPVAGLALGEAMGAAPVAVLMGTPAGAFLLVAGAALVVAGVAWTSALTGRVLS